MPISVTDRDDHHYTFLNADGWGISEDGHLLITLEDETRAMFHNSAWATVRKDDI